MAFALDLRMLYVGFFLKIDLYYGQIKIFIISQSHVIFHNSHISPFLGSDDTAGCGKVSLLSICLKEQQVNRCIHFRLFGNMDKDAILQKGLVERAENITIKISMIIQMLNQQLILICC